VVTPNNNTIQEKQKIPCKNNYILAGLKSFIQD
jgi:hypothetical protein